MTTKAPTVQESKRTSIDRLQTAIVPSYPAPQRGNDQIKENFFLPFAPHPFAKKGKGKEEGDASIYYMYKYIKFGTQIYKRRLIW